MTADGRRFLGRDADLRGSFNRDADLGGIFDETRIWRIFHETRILPDLTRGGIVTDHNRVARYRDLPRLRRGRPHVARQIRVP
jgi:hypothetical protein